MPLIILAWLNVVMAEVINSGYILKVNQIGTVDELVVAYQGHVESRPVLR